MRVAAGFSLVLLLGACAHASPPPNWAQGGSSLDLPRARWTHAGRLVDIMADGRVLIDGYHAFSIDRAGRVLDTDNSPIAVLEADGSLVGENDKPLGTVGLRNASPPGAKLAWLALAEGDEVNHFSADGDPIPDGRWVGCGAAIRTCTLATQIVSIVEDRERRANAFPTLAGPTMGLGANTSGMLIP